MIKLFHILFDSYLFSHKSKEGNIIEQFDTGYDEIQNTIEEARSKSIKNDTFYLAGSSYIEDMIQEKYPPEIINIFLKRCQRIDKLSPRIPLELGKKLIELTKDKSTYLGVHRSDSIKENPLEDPILEEIIQKGLINNGAAMQGVVNESPPYPSQTLSPGNDIMMLCGALKSSYRGSMGAVLVALPRDIVNCELDFQRGVDSHSIYHKDGYIYSFKPEYTVGFISSKDDTCKYYSKEELLDYYQKKRTI